MPEGRKRYLKSMNKSDDQSKSEIDNSEPISLQKSKMSRGTKRITKTTKSKRRKVSDSDESDEDVSALDEDMLSGVESESKCEDADNSIIQHFGHLNDSSSFVKIKFPVSPTEKQHKATNEMDVDKEETDVKMEDRLPSQHKIMSPEFNNAEYQRERCEKENKEEIKQYDNAKFKSIISPMINKEFSYLGKEEAINKKN
jgi:hypothetical protein